MKKIWKQRYQIVEKLGKGSNGQVYKVWDLHLEKEWAMKILEEKYIMSRKIQFDEKQTDELQVLKKISHPNFPRIVDAFEEDQRKILIMDLIQGITLEQIIKKSSLEEKKILSIAEQIAEAILYLHQQTPVLLYMDLKPSNIIVEETGTIKLVDLGSVIVKGSRGNISGSFGFASPEQIKVQKEGQFLKEQSDIFSFGMVLYAMAVGNSQRIPVIAAKDKYGVLVRKDNPSISDVLEKIIEKCTRGNPQRRYLSMREVKRELENWQKFYGKKKTGFWGNFIRWQKRKEQWYQEKSIFCTEGRHSFYIAKKVMLLLIGICCLLPGKMIFAGENVLGKKEEFYGKEHGSDNTLLWDMEESGERKLGVIIRDAAFRKVLIRKGCSYITEDNLLLEIPWEEIEGEKCRIFMECLDESRQKKQFLIECIYTK